MNLMEGRLLDEVGLKWNLAGERHQWNMAKETNRNVRTEKYNLFKEEFSKGASL